MRCLRMLLAMRRPRCLRVTRFLMLRPWRFGVALLYAQRLCLMRLCRSVFFSTRRFGAMRLARATFFGTSSLSAMRLACSTFLST